MAYYAMLGVALIAFAFLAYGRSFGLPFMGDDYVFLDQTRHARFADVWSFQHVDFHWYRPWSRQLHFWVMQHVAGLDARAFRLVGVALWVAALLPFAGFVRAVSGARAAVIATLGAASMPMWGTPLLWISGSQDLWMLVFAMLALLAFRRANEPVALVAYALALLSKETAAMLPLILAAHAILVERARGQRLLRRLAPFVALTALWFLMHPSLLGRLRHPEIEAVELQNRPDPTRIVLRTLLSVSGADALPRPEPMDARALGLGAASVVVLVGALIVLTRRAGRGETDEARTRVVSFGLLWALAGWLPLAMPSIGWHAYYGCLGALGAWLVLGALLASRLPLAFAVVGLVATLRVAQAETPSWDWGSIWYQRRAGTLLQGIQSELSRSHPTFPAHSRLFFARVPNNIGLIAGRSPAVRIWYDDPTIEADFYNRYQPRAALSGPDYFFRVDTLRGVVEIRAGEPDPGAVAPTAEWADDHIRLGSLFLVHGELAKATLEIEKVARATGDAQTLAMAAACRYEQGDSARASEWSAMAAGRAGLSPERTAEWVARMRASMPRAGASSGAHP